MTAAMYAGCAATIIASVTGCAADGESAEDREDAAPLVYSQQPPASSGAVVTGRPCDTVATAAEEIVEHEKATIPMVVGLTLGYVWVGPDSAKNNFDHECLAQVTAVESSRVVLESRCADPRDSLRVPARTQLCRADLRNGSMYRTEFGPAVPDLVAGSTMSMLSRRAFRELRDRGETRLRHVHLRASTWQVGAEAPDPDATVYVNEDVSGTLRKTGTGMTSVQLNDSVTQVPVIHGDVILRDPKGRIRDQQERLTILDDARVPIVLDNQRSSTASGIKFIRITWPRRTALERELSGDRASTVYGIYFDYNSAVIRAESDAVLREIAHVLASHGDWTLRIEGHTDSIGGAAFNHELSVRRAEAVRRALIDRHAIAEARLTSSGAGASRPLDTNNSPEGRARNRRVELTRP